MAAMNGGEGGVEDAGSARPNRAHSLPEWWPIRIEGCVRMGGVVDEFVALHGGRLSIGGEGSPWTAWQSGRPRCVACQWPRTWRCPRACRRRQCRVRRGASARRSAAPCAWRRPKSKHREGKGVKCRLAARLFNGVRCPSCCAHSQAAAGITRPAGRGHGDQVGARRAWRRFWRRDAWWCTQHRGCCGAARPAPGVVLLVQAWASPYLSHAEHPDLGLAVVVVGELVVGGAQLGRAGRVGPAQLGLLGAAAETKETEHEEERRIT
eukprot:scaffold2902_cov112-Isochrysis_galbana.AAC.1